MTLIPTFLQNVIYNKDQNNKSENRNCPSGQRIGIGWETRREISRINCWK